MTAEQHPDLRASDLERERTIDVLREAAGEGRLTFEELADRTGAAAEARTRGELAQLTRDLPQEADVAAPPPAAAPLVPERQRLVIGDLRRAGGWVVPAASAWRSVFGDVVLDLREARVSAPEVTIDVRTVFGDIDLLVPEGVIVDLRATSTLGNVKQDAGGSAAPGAPRVVVTGRTTFGDVRVRAMRLGERIAGWLLGRPPRG